MSSDVSEPAWLNSLTTAGDSITTWYCPTTAWVIWDGTSWPLLTPNYPATLNRGWTHHNFTSLSRHLNIKRDPTTGTTPLRLLHHLKRTHLYHRGTPPAQPAFSRHPPSDAAHEPILIFWPRPACRVCLFSRNPLRQTRTSRPKYNFFFIINYPIHTSVFTTIPTRIEVVF